MKLSTFFASALAAAFLTASSAAAVTVNAVVSPSAGLAIGDTVDITLVTSSDTPDFFGFDVTATFDSSALLLTNVTYDPFFDITNAAFVPPTVAAPSPVRILAGAFLGTAAGVTTLTTLSFEVIAEGALRVDFASEADFLAGLNQQPVFNGTTFATFTVAGNTTPPIDQTPDTSVVPLPAPLLMLLTSLLGLPLVRRRARAAV